MEHQSLASNARGRARSSTQLMPSRHPRHHQQVAVLDSGHLNLEVFDTLPHVEVATGNMFDSLVTLVVVQEITSGPNCQKDGSAHWS